MLRTRDKGPIVRWQLLVPRGFATPNSTAICRCSPERHRTSLSRSGRLRISSRICHQKPLILEPAVRAAEASKALDVCISDFCPLLCPRRLTTYSQRHPSSIESLLSKSPRVDRSTAAINPSPDLLKPRALQGVLPRLRSQPFRTSAKKRTSCRKAGRCERRISRIISAPSIVRGTGR